jgi:hypothetical protein
MSSFVGLHQPKLTAMKEVRGTRHPYHNRDGDFLSHSTLAESSITHSLQNANGEYLCC